MLNIKTAKAKHREKKGGKAPQKEMTDDICT